MRVVIAIDSFKGSLSTYEAAEAVAIGVRRAVPDAETEIFPLADGGEGTVDALVTALGGEIREILVTGPLLSPVKSRYGIVRDRKLAIMEMSSAAGITLVDSERRNPLDTTTYGVGEMIADAISEGCRDFIIGIGGSATNDGGIGMLSALGFSFLDGEGNEVDKRGRGLGDIRKVDTGGALPLLKECRFRIACDVTNPLTGENGCSAIYGPQKGADPETVLLMDGWLRKYAELTATVLEGADPDYPGAGAAGGMGFAFLAYLGGELRSGIELVTEALRLEEAIRTADVVVTGEGRLDGQSANGKAPVGVAGLAKKHGRTVIALGGALREDAPVLNQYGIDALFPILRKPCTLAEAMDKDNASANLSATAEQVFRLIDRLS